ncbi:MAG TPA: hypothetical protein VFW33_02650 [Gemmataceae bacterium]|nr:hypothetical protein [Gemmataceae bacterium]
MSSTASLLRSFLPQFETAALNCNNAFVAVAKTQRNASFDDGFLQEFYRLADRTLSPDTVISREGVTLLPTGERRPWKYDSPELRTMFISSCYEEWLLWEPLHCGIGGLRDIAAPVWSVMPNGLRGQYRPLHVLGDDWRPWQPEPAREWLYFVFRQLMPVGTVVQRRTIGEVELLYFDVNVFRACALAIEMLGVQTPVPAPKAPAKLCPADVEAHDPPPQDAFDAGPWNVEALNDEELKVRRLLLFMRHRPEATLDELCQAVWEEELEKVSDDALKAARRKANDFLDRQGLRRVLTKPRGESIFRWS